MHGLRRSSLLTSATVLLSGVLACGGGGGNRANPSIIRFISPSFTAGEGEWVLTLGVSRSGSTRGAISVTYSTSDLSATAGEDYTAASGSLAWDDGDAAEKTFTISLLDDGCLEGDEALEVSLGTPKGGRAVLGNPKVASVTITDNDTVPLGSLDPGFGTGGVVTVDPGPRDDTFTAMALDAAFLYAVGVDASPGPTDWQWRIEKRSLQDGSLDPNFGSGGVVTSNPNPNRALPFAVVAEGGWLYIAGYDEDPATLDGRWRVEKRDGADGSLNPPFGSGGVIVVNPGPEGERIFDMASDGTSLYVVGDDSGPGSGDWQWRIEKRSLQDGALDSAFGAVTSNPGSLDDTPFGIAIDSAFLYVTGYDESPGSGDWQWRTEKRSLQDGALDLAFGAVVSNPTTGDDSAYAVAVDASAVYVVGYEQATGPADTQWRVEKRDLVLGNLDVAFGVGGIVTENWSTGRDEAGSVVLDPPHLYVAGSDEDPGLGDWQWRVLRLSLLDGSRDPCFGSAGIVTSNPGPHSDHPWRMVADPTSLFIAGHAGVVGVGDGAMRIEKRTR